MIREKKAEYVLALKGNQGHLNDDVRSFFEASLSKDFEGVAHSFHEPRDEGHGRKERRRYHVVEVPAEIRNVSLWRDLRTIVMVVSEPTHSDKTTREQRYHIGSLPCDAERVARAIRSHWSVENNLHWVLDVVFREREEDSRIRKGNAAENMAMLHRLTVSLLKQDKSKGPLRRKAGWDNDFLLAVLTAHGN